MKLYSKPELELRRFCTAPVLTTSDESELVPPYGYSAEDTAEPSDTTEG